MFSRNALLSGTLRARAVQVHGDDADGCPALAPPKPLDPAKIGPTASYFELNIQYYLLVLSTLTRY